MHVSHDLLWLIFNRFMRKRYIYIMMFAWSSVGSLEKCASKSWSSLPYLQKVHGKMHISVIIFFALSSVGSLEKCASMSWSSVPYFQWVHCKSVCLSHDLCLIFRRFVGKICIYVMIILALSSVGSLKSVHLSRDLLCLIFSRFMGKICIYIMIFFALSSVGLWGKYASMSWSSWPYLQ